MKRFLTAYNYMTGQNYKNFSNAKLAREFKSLVKNLRDPGVYRYHQKIGNEFYAARLSDFRMDRAAHRRNLTTLCNMCDEIMKRIETGNAALLPELKDLHAALKAHKNDLSEFTIKIKIHSTTTYQPLKADKAVIARIRNLAEKRLSNNSSTTTMTTRPPSNSV